MRRKCLAAVGGILLLFCPGRPAETRTAPAGQESARNLLLITIDTLRADKLGCYGGRVATPHIDALARRGFLFRRAFAHNPLTLPSHTNILLGTTPLYHGVHDNVNFIATEDCLTLAEHLKKSGYATGAVIGAFPLDARFGLAQGFDFYEDDFKRKGASKQEAGERTAERVSRICLSWLENRRSPWFLWMHLFDPHFPYTPPEPFAGLYRDKPYDGEVAYVDDVLGKFFAALDERHALEETTVIFTSDHGESLGEHGEKTHGMLAYNSVLWVPLIISGPGVRLGTHPSPVSHIDIFPTACELLGLEIPSEIQGRSLRPALLGKKLPAREIFFESLEPHYNFGWAPLRGYLTDREKFIDSPIPELYDLRNDFSERANLMESSPPKKYKIRLEELMARLRNQLSREADASHDRRTLERLRGLGYTAYSFSAIRRNFGPADDVKTLLPYYNRCIEAYTLEGPGAAEEGITRLKKLIEQNPRLHQSYYYLGRLLQSSGKIEEALAVLAEGHERHPHNFEILDLYALNLVTSGRFDDAIRLLEKQYLIQMEQDPRPWISLGRAYLGKGDFQKAVAAFETAVDIDGRFADAAAWLGRAYVELAQRSESEDDFFQAVRYLETAIALDPQHPEALYDLGTARYQIGEADEAVRLLEEAVLLGSTQGKIHYYLGMAHMKRGRWAKAYRYFTDYRATYLPLLTPGEQKELAVHIQTCRARLGKSPQDNT